MIDALINRLLGFPTCFIHAGGDPRFDILAARLLRLGSTSIIGSVPLFLRCPPEAFVPAGRLFFVDTDVFLDKGELVDALLAFRKQRPGSVVCLVSDSFDNIDLGTERIMICDGSVAKSLMSINVVALLRALEVNNTAWRDRFETFRRLQREVVRAS